MLEQIDAIFFNRVSILSVSFITANGNMRSTRRLSLAMTEIKTFYGNSMFPLLKG